MAERDTPKQRVKELIAVLRERIVEHVIAGLNPGAKGEAAPYRASVKRAEAALLAEFEGLTAQREAALPTPEEMEALSQFIDFGATRGMHLRPMMDTENGPLAPYRDTALSWRSRMRALSPTESREHP